MSNHKDNCSERAMNAPTVNAQCTLWMKLFRERLYFNNNDSRNNSLSDNNNGSRRAMNNDNGSRRVMNTPDGESSIHYP